jgi:hypothetical protein
MNRSLMIGLAVVAGLSLYLSTNQSDDALLAPGKQGARTGAAAKRDSPPRDDQSPNGRVSSRSTDRAAKATPLEPWVADALTQGVTQWQARVAQETPSKPDQQAWAGMRPPPPPPQRVVAQEAPPPPPPPMAPRFPHAWVGRFNDEPVVVAAASGASAVNVPGVARAVLTGPQATWVVRAGDVIEGQWRVDQIQDRTMSLTYLPLKQQQTVAMR